jgi:hypothetical protein
MHGGFPRRGFSMPVSTRTGRATAYRCPDTAYSHMDVVHMELEVARFHVGIWRGLQGSRRRVPVPIAETGNAFANIEIDIHQILEWMYCGI